MQQVKRPFRYRILRPEVELSEVTRLLRGPIWKKPSFRILEILEMHKAVKRLALVCINLEITFSLSRKLEVVVELSTWRVIQPLK